MEVSGCGLIPTGTCGSHWERPTSCSGPLSADNDDDDDGSTATDLTYALEDTGVSECFRLLLMVIDLWQYEEGTWPGFTLLADLEGIKFGFIAKLDLETIRQFVVYVPDALLVKLKSIHFINVPPFMDRLNAMSKHFMNKEFNEMITVHPPGDLSGLANVLDLDILPKEVGGKYKSVVQLRDETLAKVKANQEFFAAESKKRVSECLRPGKPKTITDVFGSVEGSFKQLQID